MKRYKAIQKLKALVLTFALCLALAAGAGAASAAGAVFKTDDVWTLNFYDQGSDHYVTVTRLQNAYTSSLEGVTVDSVFYPLSKAVPDSVLTDDYGNTWQAEFLLDAAFSGSYSVTANSELLTIQIDGGNEVSYSRDELAACLTTNAAGLSYCGDKSGSGDFYYGITTEYISLPDLLRFLELDPSSVTSMSFRPIDWAGNSGYIRTLTGSDEITPAVLSLKGYQCDSETGATADKTDTLNAFRLIPKTNNEPGEVVGFSSVKWINYISISTAPVDDPNNPQPSNPGTGSGGGSGSSSVPADSTTTVTDDTSVTIVDSGSLSDAVANAGSNGQVIIDADVPLEGVAQKVMIMTGEDVKTVANSDASVKANLTFADVVLPNAAFKDLDRKNGAEITITAAAQGSGAVIKVAVDGVTLDSVDGGLQVFLPVSQPTPGMVMVLVNSDGTETLLKKSAVGTDAVSAAVPGSCTVKVIDNTKLFRDVDSSSWYAGSVAFAASHELFNGTSDTTFDPNGLMTRGMLVTVLHRLEDTPAAKTPNIFADVAAGLWYTDAVVWANENGIVTGTGAGFEPNGTVTREQLATILYRYAKYLGLDVSATGDLSQFQDSGNISDWASEAMRWAVGTGIITGKSDVVLDPHGSASRAEVAAMLQRLICQAAA